MPERVALSVVLATIEPWPDLANCLAVLAPQIAAEGGEVIDGDVHGDAQLAAKVSFRRSEIGSGPIESGWLELELNARLFYEGRCAVHDGLTVTHVQSHGFWLTMLSHFDNGRSTTGLRSGSRMQLPWTLFWRG